MFGIVCMCSEVCIRKGEKEKEREGGREREREMVLLLPVMTRTS